MKLRERVSRLPARRYIVSSLLWLRAANPNATWLRDHAVHSPPAEGAMAIPRTARRMRKLLRSLGCDWRPSRPINEYDLLLRGLELRVKPRLLREKPERVLYGHLHRASRVIEEWGDWGYGDLLEAYILLCPYINAFLDACQVNSEDKRLRQNRMGLLRWALDLLYTFGDWEQVECAL